MTHDITALPWHQNRSAWERSATSLLSRMLCKRETVEHLSAALVRQGLEAGTLRVEDADIQNAGQSALLAFLARTVIATDDLGKQGSSEPSPAPMAEDEQAIVRFLVEAGCSLTQPLDILPGGADAMDLLLALNADHVLEENLPRIDWASRTMVGLPWLHYAARRGMAATLEVLLRHGAQVNGVDGEGNTALFHASDAACVDVLLRHGADPAHFNEGGDTALVHWEAKRKIKGERLSQMRAALSKAALALTPEQAFGQFLKSASTMPRARLEKQVRQLGLSGAERQQGVGLQRVMLDRCGKEIGGSQRGAEFNQCTALVEFMGRWSGMAQANTAELCEAHLIGALWPNEDLVASSMLHLRRACPHAQARENALQLAARRLLDRKFNYDAHLERLLLWAVSSEDPMCRADIVLTAASSLKKMWSTHDTVAQAWEKAWMQHPNHPAWRAPGLVGKLVGWATELTHASSQSHTQFQLAMGRMAEHAISAGACVDEATLAKACSLTHLNPRQREWLDGFVALVDAQALDRGTVQDNAPRRGPRL